MHIKQLSSSLNTSGLFRLFPNIACGFDILTKTFATTLVQCQFSCKPQRKYNNEILIIKLFIIKLFIMPMYLFGLSGGTID